MLAPLFALMAGALLAATGAALVSTEMALFDARMFLRQAVMRQGSPPLQTIDAVHLAFSSGPKWRSELAASKFELDTIVWEGQSYGTPAAKRSRIVAAAIDTVTALPFHGRAWCLLAMTEIQSGGLTARAARILERCYETAPRDIVVVERRLLLSLVNWPLLNPELRRTATRDMSGLLPDREFGPWLAERLAYASILLVPEQSAMLEQAVRTHGNEAAVSAFERAVRGYRATIRPRSEGLGRAPQAS